MINKAISNKEKWRNGNNYSVTAGCQICKDMAGAKFSIFNINLNEKDNLSIMGDNYHHR